MKSDKQKQEINKQPTAKFVKKAGQWCKTSWIHGKQVQEWSETEPCLHRALHDGVCLSCNKKINDIRK